MNIDNIEGIKDLTHADGRLDFVLCRTCKNCPNVSISVDEPNVTLGGDHEGYSIWTKQQFLDLISFAKSGVFDEFI